MDIRPATAADAPAIQAIYAHHVTHGTGTFEEVPPSLEEMQRRMDDVAARGMPWVVAEYDGEILGYAYAAPFRLRAAYRYTAEDSVYVSPLHQGKGVGKAVLGRVITECTALGLRQLLGVIGDSANGGSIGVHRSCGFEMIGTCPGLGYKHGGFLDVVFMQLPLNGGTEGLPMGPGLSL